jgi:hypothetical protein
MGPLIDRLGEAPLIDVPLLDRDVHDLAALREIGVHLTGRT